jgi:hypothetical protein
MKKSYILQGLFAILAVVAVGIAFNVLAGLAGGALALAATSGTIPGKSANTEEIDAGSSQLVRPTISQQVTEMKPSRTPLDTIMRTAVKKNVKARAWKYEYYAIDNRPFTDTVATAYTAGTAERAAIEVDDVNIWNQDDTALVRDSTGDDDHEYVLYIYAVDRTAGTISVICLNNSDNSDVVPSIAEDAVLTRMGNAKHEEDAQTDPFAMVPQKSYNYLQYFMAQIEQSNLSMDQEQEVQYGWGDFARQQVYDLRATMELSLLFGFRAEMTDPLDSTVKYLTGGAIRFIDNELTYGTGGANRTITHDDLIDWSKAIFASNAGSTSRVMFSGSGFTANLMKIKKVQDSTTDVTVDYLQKQLEAQKTEVKLGLTFKKIETNFGSIYHYYHPLFDEAGWTDKAVVLDVNNLEKAVRKPMNKRKIDLLASGQKNAKALVLEEICALIVRYPDTHATIAPAA